MLNDRNDLEIGGFGDWLPDRYRIAYLYGLARGLVSLAGGEFFTPMDRMDRILDWAGGMDSGLRRNDG